MIWSTTEDNACTKVRTCRRGRPGSWGRRGRGRTRTVRHCGPRRRAPLPAVPPACRILLVFGPRRRRRRCAATARGCRPPRAAMTRTQAPRRSGGRLEAGSWRSPTGRRRAAPPTFYFYSPHHVHVVVEEEDGPCGGGGERTKAWLHHRWGQEEGFHRLGFICSPDK